MTSPPEAPASLPSEGGDASGPAKPDPRRPLDGRARPVAAALHLLWPLVWIVVLLLVLVGTVVGGAVWLLRTEGGTRWLLQRVPGVEVQGLQGALLGTEVAADRVRVTWKGGKASVTLTGFRGTGLAWQWQPRRGLWVGIDAATLAAREVIVDTGPGDGTPATVPESLQIPLRVASPDVRIGELRINSIGPWRNVQGDAAVSDGDAYRLRATRFDWDRVTIAGDARLGMSPPFALEGAVQVTPQDASYGAGVKAGGSLGRMRFEVALRGAPPASGGPAPSADVQAEILPFAPWWLGALSARTEALNLASLASALPETRIAGRADVQTSAKDAPVTATVQLDNTLPGRWDERRLPLARLAAELGGSTSARDRVEIHRFDATLADTRGSAGRIGGKGTWNGHALALETVLDAVQPQRLHGRAAAMALSGPVALQADGLPSPAGGTPPPLALAVKATLEGRLDAAPQPVQLVLDASAADDRIEIRDLRARSGSALAQLTASARHGPKRELLLATSGTLTDFDPLPWWPGAPGSAWRQGPHRVSGSWQADLRAPPDLRRLAPVTLVQQLSGTGRLRITESVLAGVPVSADLTLGQTPGAGGATSSLRGEVHLANNVIAVDGQGDPMGAGSADRLKLDLDAPSLAALAPLLRLAPDLAPWAPKAGSAKASLTAQGRWPTLRTEGRATLDKLEAGELGITRGSTSWQLVLDAEGRQPLSIQAELAGMRWGKQRAERLRAEARGTPRQHQFEVSGALPLTPPPAAEQLFGVRAMSGSRAQLQAEGAWEPAAGGGGTWRGRLAKLAIGNWDGGSLDGDTRANWVDARELTAELGFDAAGSLQRVQAAPGRVKLADALQLRWDEVRVDLSGAQPDIDLRADIETFAVAPLLARIQPAFGWQGDLQLGARIELKAAQRFDADIVFERKSGDLQVADETGTQALGLTDLRLGLAAHDGTWTFTQAFAGKALGEMAGLQSVKTTPERRWPQPDAPLEGVLELRVANLGVWGAWVPPGWRLGGELRTSATLGGRFGAPEYTGAVRGTDIAVRNLLQGVNVSQGTVAIALKGTTAQIETFTLKGGDGTIKLTGGAEFGSAPVARVHAEAERFRVLGRIDRRLVASGSGDLVLQSDRVQLDGRLVIDEGRFDISRSDAPALDDDVTVRRPSDAEKPADAPAAQRPRRNVVVTVDVDLGEQLHLSGRGLDTQLAGKLRITTPNGRLAVAGTVNTEGGTYAAYGQKLDIERGIVAFSGVPDNPRLDILALRPNIDARVGVQITGFLLTPRVRLYSESDLSDTDKLSWLVLGRASDGLGRSDTALLQRAAVALLSGEDGAPTDALMKNIGLDDLSIKQSDGEVRETVISLGKQLSRRWYLGYERGVNATTGTWQLIYRIAQRFTLRAQSGLENSLDVIWTWKFDDLPLPEAVRKSPPTPP